MLILIKRSIFGWLLAIVVVFPCSIAAVANTTVTFEDEPVSADEMRRRMVDVFRIVGFKFGNWVDVGYWQVLLQAPAPDGRT
jgi:L-amino acid N-acyltransferase YncA